MKHYICIILFFLFSNYSFGQDPHFSQFFSAPHLNNPALAGTQYGDWAVMANIRQQWGNASTPFNTQALAGECKINNGSGGENYFAIGSMLMNDQTMNGAFRSNYANASFAYHRKLSHNHRIAAGFHGSYANRRLDYSRLQFGSQFDGSGFDVAIPAGETGLSSMKPFFSLGAGILYTLEQNEGDFLMDIGYASFDINRPNQSFLKDPNNQLNIRHVGYFNLQSYQTNDLYYQISSVFHYQALQNYFAIGGSLGLSLANEFEKMFLVGCWFREGDAIYPYTAFRFKGFQVGLNYDITLSKQNLGPSNPRTFELSLILTGKYPKSNYYDCPFKNRYVRF